MSSPAAAAESPPPRRGGMGRGRGRGRGRGGRSRGGWRHNPYPPPPLIRPIFDWTEVGQQFPQAAPQLDSSLLAQLLSKRVQEITPSSDEQSVVQGFCTKVATVVENMILTGEGEELLLDEVRGVGPQRRGTALAGDMVSELVVLLRDLPTELLVRKLGAKVATIMNAANEEVKGDEGKARSEDEGGRVTLRQNSPNCFELQNRKKAVIRVYVTSTGDKVYGRPPPPDSDIIKSAPLEEALRMIRQTRWWDDHTSHLKGVRPLVRILKDMQDHVPGLSHFSSWYIEILANCAIIPLVGEDPLPLVDAFKRVWQLLSAGLFLPGSIGVPDPCEESEKGIHENMTPQQCDELSRQSQMVLQLLQFGAYREVLAVDDAKPIDFTEAYSFGGVTLSVPQPAYEKPPAQEVAVVTG